MDALLFPQNNADRERERKIVYIDIIIGLIVQ